MIIICASSSFSLPSYSFPSENNNIYANMSYCLQFVCVFFCLNFPFRFALLPLSLSASLVAIPVHRYIVVSTLSLCIRHHLMVNFLYDRFLCGSKFIFPLCSICLCFLLFIFSLLFCAQFIGHIRHTCQLWPSHGIQCKIRM